LRGTFSIGMVVLMTCIVITTFATKEIPLSKDDAAAKPAQNPFITIIKGILRMPKPMRRVCIVQFFTWIGWFTFFLYITTWVAENIYGGNPNAAEGTVAKELFDEGVRKGAFGLMCNAGVTMLMSLILPLILRVLGIRIVYFSSLIIFGVCLLLPIWIHTPLGAILLLSAFGIPWSVVMVAPYTLVAMSVDEAESGLYMGVLNIFVVIPQIIVSLGIGFIIQLFKGNLAYALATGGIFAFVAAFCVFFLIIKEKTALPLHIAAGGH